MSFASSSFLSISFRHYTFILPSFLFCPPRGVEVMPLKTNIPELHLLLMSLKGKKNPSLTMSDHLLFGERGGTERESAKKEKVRRRQKDGID